MLALAGLSGVVTGDMQLRNIGIVGCMGVFLVVTALLAVLFYRTTPQGAQHAHQAIATETLAFVTPECQYKRRNRSTLA